MSSALESNAGDRYHFVYAARRLMDLLHPDTRLHLVVMEGVAAADAVSDDPDAYLGVDLTEYYGGDAAATADDVHVVQVN